MDENPPLPTGQERRERIALARAHARSLHRNRLTAMLAARQIDDPADVAEAVMQVLFGWSDITTGKPCRCSCHPQLPSGELHEFGASCGCTRTPEQRRAARQEWLDDVAAFWRTPAGQRLHAGKEAAEAALRGWLAQHPGVIVHSHGGWAPEQWTGEVDGRRFYFRERHGDWHIEIDPHPSTGAVSAAGTSGTAGDTVVAPGEVIATGTVDMPGYGDTAVQRARFIVTTIRDHLRRQTCTHRGADRDAPHTVAADARPRWCPECGARLQQE